MSVGGVRKTDFRDKGEYVILALCLEIVASLEFTSSLDARRLFWNDCLS